MTNDKFCGDETYDEWVSKQYDSLELKIIQEIHNVYPNWNLDDIKRYAPNFMAAHLKIIKKINDNDITLSMKDTEDRVLNYVSAGINGSKIHVDVFGDDVPKDDYKYLSKWNLHLCKIMRILIYGTKYKNEDELGHAATHTIRFNNYPYGFRSEMELDRDIKEIVELNRERYGTKSDFFKELIFKGVAIHSIINKGQLGERAKDISNDVKKYERRENAFKIRDILADIGDIFKERYETLKDIEDDREALEEFRDDITRFISDELDRNCNKQDKAKIRSTMMKNRELSRILDILEGEELISKKYVESILEKGVVVSYINIIPEEDVKSKYL